VTYDQKHIDNLVAYSKKLEAAFIQAGQRAATMVENPSAKFSKSFAFGDNQVLAKQIKAIINDLQSNVVQIIAGGNITEWALSNNKNDALVNSFVKNFSNIKKNPDWTNRNESALKAFNEREVNGINLSDRVWAISSQLQSELEVQVGYGLLNGDSAAIVSQRIRQYLKDPESLFRRVRNDVGELEWSKAAKLYHPGQGVYRSAFKNARRLAVTETNMAYRMADHTRWNQLGFVKGFEVKLSHEHPMLDICDTLQGEYPKGFIFTGWHPLCLCHAIAVTMGMDEFGKYQNSILDGTNDEFLKSVKNVDQVPEGFSSWIGANAERSKAWKDQPYFIKDNFKNGNIEKGFKFAKNITMRFDYKASGVLYSDVTGFISIINSIIEAGQKGIRSRLINELKEDKDLISDYINKDFGTQIFKHKPTKILMHEFVTAKKLTDVNYDVIFAPKGMFKTKDKKFDVFVIYKDKYLIRADLKANFEPTKNSIFKSIESGSKQAEHIVLDINSEISINDLIDGLRSGLIAGKNVKSVMLFYKKQFLNLDRNAVFSKVIYKLLK